MKKKILILTTVFSATMLLLSSCLKDDAHYVNFANGGTFVDFPLGGFVNFSAEAITESADANGLVVRQFAVNVASANLPTTPTTITLAAGDATDVAALNKLQSNVVYELMPSDAYHIYLTKVTVPAGKQNALDSVQFDKTKLDPAKSYVLPLKITDGGGQKISGNLNVLYYHFIGNDFAGVYEHFYTRFEDADSTDYANRSSNRVDEGTDIFFPVDPTHFMVVTDYYYQPSYLVSFTKTGSGASATYSNWAITFPPDQVLNYLTTPSGGAVVLVTAPQFRPLHIAFDPTRQYTYAESLKLFRFYFTTGSRAIFDEFVKP